MKCRLAFLIAALAAGPIAAMPAASGDGDRWIQARVEAPSEDERARLSALGFEVMADEDGSATVFLPASATVRLPEAQLSWTPVHDDLEGWYAARLAGAARPGLLGTGSMGGYDTWTEAVAVLDDLARSHPSLVAPRLSLGTTHEGRDIWVWKLASSAGGAEPAPAILLLALMHAREPAGMMSLLYLAERLVACYGSDPEATYLLDHRQVWILPVLNPDGYVYNESRKPGGGGMWRKNRRDNGDGSFGVDPNRNFGFGWAFDDLGSSGKGSDDTYRGPGPMSEPETVALRDFVRAHVPAISVNTHAYSDVFIRPWGYADELCADNAVFADIAEMATRGNAFVPGNVPQTLGYLANGSHDDYMYGEVGEKARVMGMTPELGNGNDGFWPAPERIEPLEREACSQHVALIWAAGSAPRLLDFATSDAPPGGDGDGWLEPGETVQVVVTVRNRGLEPSLGPLDLELESGSCALLVEDGSATLGVVDAGASADNRSDAFRIRVASGAEAGALTPLSLRLRDGGGELPALSLSLLVGEPQILLSEDFEGGLPGWRLTSFDCEAAGVGRPGLALSDSVGGDSPAGSDAIAGPLSPFGLAGFAHAWLEFDHRFWIDNDFDAATVEVNTGTGWVPVAGESSDVGSGAGAQPAGVPVWDGHLVPWTRERVDLSSFAGPGRDPLFLRFRFRSDASIGYDGWHVDDVRLLGFGASPSPQAPGPPRQLLAVKRSSDVSLVWTAPAVDASHGEADAYSVYRSPGARAERGFVLLVDALSTGASDPGALGSAASFAYQVTADSCAGTSPLPPR